MEPRNPYLVLGVPFGSTREEAAEAFARRMRSLPADPVEAEARRTDLIWAMRRLEETTGPPESEPAPYRVPADPRAGVVAGSGLLHPPPEPRAFDADQVAVALARVRAGAAREVLRRLLSIRAASIEPPGP